MQNFLCAVFGLLLSTPHNFCTFCEAFGGPASGTHVVYFNKVKVSPSNNDDVEVDTKTMLTLGTKKDWACECWWWYRAPCGADGRIDIRLGEAYASKVKPSVMRDKQVDRSISICCCAVAGPFVLIPDISVLRVVHNQQVPKIY